MSKGFTNHGNTCYMNSALQCLSHLITFHPNNENFFNTCSKANEDSLIYEWFHFQREMWKNQSCGPHNPMKLLQRFQKMCNDRDLYFSNFSQNDIDLEIPLNISIDQRIEGAAKVGAHKTSMLQDYERGKELELDALVVAVKEIGGLLSIKTPIIDKILYEVKEKISKQ